MGGLKRKGKTKTRTKKDITKQNKTKTKKKGSNLKQKGGFANIEPTKSMTESIKFGEMADSKLSLYELNGFPGPIPKPDCTIL